MKRLFVVSALVLGLGFAVSCSKKESAPTETQPAAQTSQFTLNVTVEPQDAGTVTPANGAFDANSTVTLTATANPNFAFDRWEGDVTGNTASVQVTMDANKNVKAIFKPAEAAGAPGNAAPADANTQQPPAEQPAAK